ncbi:MAG: hypothetical protein HYV04_17575, partial [Deltaproteobacteria bacterium]|nr:hypothetical protein [Deltaproteobacteria bacterium]
VDFRHPPAPLLSLMAGGAADISADFTYQVAPDRTFTVNQGPVTRTVVAGPAGEIGETSIINGIKFSGYISHDLKTLVMSTNSPTVETRTDEDGNILDYRICHRARTAVKIK